MKRIAIIGGGISGLSAAFALQQRGQGGAPVAYVLYESGPRLGGVLRTERVDGCVVEAGPDSFLTEKPWAAELCRQIGLDGQLMGSNDAERKTYILLKDKLVPLPDGLMFMVPTKIFPVIFSPLFSFGAKFRMAREWFCKPQVHGDEPVATLVERHYGAEMVERVADPLLAGVYGGMSSQLGVRAVLPRFAEMEAKHGSLSKGMLAARKRAQGAGSVRPLFTTLRDGMQQLTDSLAARLDAASLRLNSPVHELQPQGTGWNVVSSGARDFYDAIILAASSHAASLLLRNANPGLALELESIPYTSSITVALGYAGEVRSVLPPGFGFLVPRSAGKAMLAATFVHNKFPHRAPPDRALIRCFLGGANAERLFAASDDEILTLVRAELAEILALKASPLFSRVYRWRSAMPQYGVGHLDRLARIESLRQRLPNVFLAGNAYSGIGVPDCVRSGQAAAEQAAAIRDDLAV